MFKNHFIFILLLLFLNKAGKSQQEDTLKPAPKNSVYLELGGKGRLYSFNYERQLWNKNKWGLNGHAGFTYAYIPFSAEILQMPISLSILYGSKSSKIDGGIGALVIYNFNPSPPTRKQREELRKGPDRNAIIVIPRVYAFATPFLGYRYQANNGFLFRATFTPIIEASFYYNTYIIAAPWGGVSIGYSF